MSAIIEGVEELAKIVLKLKQWYDSAKTTYSDAKDLKEELDNGIQAIKDAYTGDDNDVENSVNDKFGFDVITQNTPEEKPGRVRPREDPSPTLEPTAKKQKMLRGTWEERKRAFDHAEPNDGDVNMEGETSAPTTLARASMSSTRTAGFRDGETPVVNIPISLRSPWPKTVQVVHTYYDLFDSDALVNANDPYSATWRLDSIYDVKKDVRSFASVEQGAVAQIPDSSPNPIQKPTYRSYWGAFYQYWHVVKSNWRLRMRVDPIYTGDNPSASARELRETEFLVYFYQHGNQFPPLTDGSSGSLGLRIPHYIRREHDDMFYTNLRPVTDVTDHDFNGWKSIDGTWTKDTIHHSVSEDENKQVWHKTTEVPPELNALTVIVEPSPTSMALSGTFKIQFEFTIEYHTQWKDLKRDYQYPTQLTANPSITNIAQQLDS